MGKSSDAPDIFPGNIEDVNQIIRAMERSAIRQGRAGLELGAINQTGPGGTIRFRGTPGKDFRVVTRLPKQQRRLLRQSRKAQRRLQKIGQKQLKRAGRQLRQPVLGGQDILGSAQELEQATFDRAQNLLQPGLDEERQRTEQSLIDRGIPRSSDAFKQEMDDLSRRQNTALENAALTSIGAGRQEQSRLLGADIARRGNILSEIAGMAIPGAGAQAPLSFGPQPTPQMPAVNAGAPFQMLSNAGLQGMQQQQMMNQAGKGGLFGLGAAGIAAAPFFGGGGSSIPTGGTQIGLL